MKLLTVLYALLLGVGVKSALKFNKSLTEFEQTGLGDGIRAAHVVRRERARRLQDGASPSKVDLIDHYLVQDRVLRTVQGVDKILDISLSHVDDFSHLNQELIVDMIARYYGLDAIDTAVRTIQKHDTHAGDNSNGEEGVKIELVGLTAAEVRSLQSKVDDEANEDSFEGEMRYRLSSDTVELLSVTLIGMTPAPTTPAPTTRAIRPPREVLKREERARVQFSRPQREERGPRVPQEEPRTPVDDKDSDSAVVDSDEGNTREAPSSEESSSDSEVKVASREPSESRTEQKQEAKGGEMQEADGKGGPGNPQGGDSTGIIIAVVAVLILLGVVGVMYWKRVACFKPASSRLEEAPTLEFQARTAGLSMDTVDGGGAANEV